MIGKFWVLKKRLMALYSVNSGQEKRMNRSF